MSTSPPPPPPPQPPPQPQRGKLAWHCRRGRKELDELLLRWFDRRYGQASAEQRALFAWLLEVSDPQLARWLLAGERPADSALAALLDAIATPESATPESATPESA